MRLPEVRARLQELEAAGFVPSERRGPTGIGHTLETRLGLAENNLPIPDIGGRVEVKATRNNWNNLITLFTLDRRVWQHPAREIVKRWGYVDGNGRSSLYTTVSAETENAFGLQISVSDDANHLYITHMPSGTTLAVWDMFHIVGKFVTKFERMLFVHADSRKVGGIEEFHFNRADILSEPSAITFKDGFADGIVTIDIRMHLRENGTPRNHGTGFRTQERNLPSLFGRIDRLV